jgi:hypothetical protein
MSFMYAAGAEGPHRTAPLLLAQPGRLLVPSKRAGAYAGSVESAGPPAGGLNEAIVPIWAAPLTHKRFPKPVNGL